MKVLHQNKTPTTGGVDAVAIDQHLASLRQAGSLQDIGAELKAIANGLDGAVTGEKLLAEMRQIYGAATHAFKNKPTGLRSILSEAKGADVKLFLGTGVPAEAKERAAASGLELGRSEFQIFSTGDPFTFLGEQGDSKKGLPNKPENVKGKTVYVVQGYSEQPDVKGLKDGQRYDLPTAVAESLQIANAAITNGAKRAVLVLPESLNPKSHPTDAFAELVHTLALATGIHVDDIRYATGLEQRTVDAHSKIDVRQGLPSLGPKTRDAEGALLQLAEAKDLGAVQAAITKLDVAIAGLEGKYSEASTAIARKVADVLAERMSTLVPSFGDNAVLSTGARSIVLSGQSNPELAEKLAQVSGSAFTQSHLEFQKNGAPRATFGGSVAGREVMIVQTTRQDPYTSPDNKQSVSALLAEALMLFKSAMEQGATDAKLVLPYMPSGRSDKNDQKGVGAYAGLVARWVDAIVDDGRKLAEARGKRLEFNPRVVMVEPHDVHNPVFFRTPVDVISGAEVLVGTAIKELGRENMVLVRPDAGAAKRTAAVGKAYHLPVVDGEKTRAGNDDKATVEKLAKPEDVRGKKCVVTDDEIATGGTMRQTVSMLAFERVNKPGDKDDGKIANEQGLAVETHGGTPKRLAAQVHVAISHTNMPTNPEERADAIRKLKEAGATHLYVLDTQPMGKLPADLEGFVKVVSAAESIADVLGNLKVSGA